MIVEGPSDEQALGVVLSKLYDPNKVFVQIMHCDITTKWGVTPDNILSNIGSIVREYARNNSFKKNDFKEIIHIVDTDGAFVSDESVVEDQTAKKVLYSPTKIRTANRESLIQRNQQKRTNLNKLVGDEKLVWGVPYRVFYMSCNLDHVLYNQLNTNDTEKENNAYLFARKYKNDIWGFCTFISESEFSVVGNYQKSWGYIKQNLHSLERHTNLGICFADIYESKTTPNPNT